jgi:hypothetical protein
MDSSQFLENFTATPVFSLAENLDPAELTFKLAEHKGYFEPGQNELEEREILCAERKDREIRYFGTLKTTEEGQKDHDEIHGRVKACASKRKFF